MKETGILFTPPNIRLILDDLKWETRRVIRWKIRPQEKGINLSAASLEAGHYFTGRPELGWVLRSRDGGSCWNDRTYSTQCPYGDPGDRLYVKEGVIIHCSIPQVIGYYMDGCRASESWLSRRTAMFMPKWAARTWLEITNIRVQRVQEISEADCVAEGCPKDYLLGRNWYKNLWDEINGKKHPWASNPFCWCLTFRRVQP